MLNKEKQESFYIQKMLSSQDTSQIRKYQDIIIGNRNLLYFIKFELVMLLSSGVPGALGLWLRSKLYPLLIGQTGMGVVFGINVALRHPHKIQLGNNVIIDDNCVLDAKGTQNKGISIANGVFIGRNTLIYCKDGDISIGENSSISFNCDIFSGHIVSIGQNVQMSAYTFLNGGTHRFDRTDVPVIQQERSARGIIVEDNVWLGANVKVLDGVVIGRDAIVAAGSVVDKDIPPLAVAVGVPARIARLRQPGEAYEPGGRYDSRGP